MKILLIHNKYKHRGGEDSVFEIEKNLLESHHHDVRTIFFDNDSIDTLAKTIKLGHQLIYNKDSRKIVEDAIHDFKPDVIHVHNLFYVASPSILYAAHKNKIPVIVTLHNYRLICSGSLLMRDSKPCELCVNGTFPVYGVKYGCHRSSKIQTAQLTLTTGIHKVMKTWNTKVSLYITLTEFARAKFINSSLKLLPEQVVVKSNSVDDIASSAPHGRENYFLFIGRLSSEKGIEVLLRAFENKTNIIEIIGDGPLREMVVKMAAENPNIRYSGYRDKAFIFSRLKKCSALIVPSVCYEGLPTAVLEAYATGTPVIISDIENLNEIVTHDYNGIHFKTNNSDDLSMAVEDFGISFRSQTRLYENARNTYLEKYTHEINYQNLMKIYESVVGAEGLSARENEQR